MNNYSNLGDFNITAQNNVLSFQLNNEVGASINLLEDEEQNDVVLLRLVSKTGNILSEAELDMGKYYSHGELESVVLLDEQRLLDFTIKDGTHIYCSLVDLYNKIINQQTLIAGSGINIINNVISVSELHGVTYEEINI